MLVLSRNVNERILIGDDVAVQVLSVHGHKVRLGFTAPDNTRILREEIYDLIAAENAATNGGETE